MASKFILSKACLISIGLNPWQQTLIHAPHLMHWYSLTLSAVNALALGSLGSLDSVEGFRRPTLSSAGTVKFIMTSATKEAPKNCRYVIISTVNIAVPTPKIICPMYVNGVVAGSVAIKNAKNTELPMNIKNRNHTR